MAIYRGSGLSSKVGGRLLTLQQERYILIAKREVDKCKPTV